MKCQSLFSWKNKKNISNRHLLKFLCSMPSGNSYYTVQVSTCMYYLILATSSKNVLLGICRQQRPRLACTSMQSAQGLDCPFTESPNTTEHTDI